MTGKRATITDVARVAGVSTASVSKVLRGSRGVSAATEATVRRAMEELGYRPHAAARGMRGQTYTIGAVMSDLSNPFFPEIVEGMRSQLEGTDYQVLLGPGGPGAPGQHAMTTAMLDRQMDGMILIAPAMPPSAIDAAAQEKPLVVIGNHGVNDHWDTVVDDDLRGAALIVDHLTALGHRRIGYIAHRDDADAVSARQPHSMRANGYRAAMTAAGLAAEIDVVQTSWTEEGGYQGALELLSRPQRPTAVFAGADVAALGVLRAVFEADLRVPEDVSVVGYDNTSIASLRPISLTSVDQSGRVMGASATRLLLERIEGRTRGVNLTIAPRLVERTSTGPAPADG